MTLHKIQGKLKNCANCGRAFVSTRNERLCRECLIEEREKETQILEYVRDNPGVDIKTVLEATGASEKLLQRMIREGLFVNIERGDFYYPCTACGRPIRTGTYCSDCLARLRKETQKAAAQLSVKVKTQKQIENMSTIERLNTLAEKELEEEKGGNVKRHMSRGMYESILESRRR